MFFKKGSRWVNNHVRDKQWVCHPLPRFLARLILQNWRWNRYIPPKLQLTFNALHGVIPKKRAILILAFVLWVSLTKLCKHFSSLPRLLHAHTCGDSTCENANSHWWFVLCWLYPICVAVGVRRERLALSIGLMWVGSKWRRRQNPVSETPCL
jgi:hypothetical protein